MPLNLIKAYPDLLDIDALNEYDRNASLQRVFRRDIEENGELNFRGKKIRPTKGEIPEMQNLFNHLTREVLKDENGKKTKQRVYEPDRSKRLHWISYYLEEKKIENVKVFSIEEKVESEYKIRTYIYDIEQKYVIVLEPQRSGRDYYLLSAYFLNKDYGEKEMNKKLKKRLSDVY